MRLRTVCFVRDEKRAEERGLLIDTLAGKYLLDHIGQIVPIDELSSYRIDLDFVANINLGESRYGI